jgi:putative colanic acid biosynthesis acetyltransferase WcaF
VTNPAIEAPDSRALGLPRGPSFPLWHRGFRAIWWLMWWALASWTPAPLHPWRVLLLRLFGARIGRGARVYRTTRVWYPPNLELGDNAVLGPEVNCYCQGRVTVGDNATVSQFAHLVTGTHDIDNPGFRLVIKPITIGAEAWVGAGAMVGPGVSIGEGAVLGGGAVCFRDLDPWTVYAGNPCRRLRARRSPVN